MRVCRTVLRFVTPCVGFNFVLVWWVWVCLASSAWAAGEVAAPLKLLVSLEQPRTTAPFPVRATLHLHNAGPEPLWLYRRARPRPEAGRVVNGSTLAVRLEPVELPASTSVVAPATGATLESVGLPRPKLVRLAPGDDYEEKAIIHLEPARVKVEGTDGPLWGRYRLIVTYGASYANANAITRSTAMCPWQGEVSGNPIEVELLPPAGQGSLSGRVINPAGEFLLDARVSLSDEQQRLVEQVVTGFGGSFSFAHLPAGFYWVTSRLEHAAHDTAVFRHVELASGTSAGQVDLVYIPAEPTESKKLLHKPVLLRVFDKVGQPTGDVTIQIAFMNGTVVEDKKLESGDDGIVATELIPGSNYVTLKRRGCPSQVQRLEVAAGDGIDAFKLVAECGAP